MGQHFEAQILNNNVVKKKLRLNATLNSIAGSMSVLYCLPPRRGKSSERDEFSSYTVIVLMKGFHLSRYLYRGVLCPSVRCL
jgi:hypothetical protein